MNFSMILKILGRQKSPGTSFEAGPTPRAPEGPPKTFWAAPEGSVALPESSGKVAGGFGRVLGGK